jgi:hypothetical protein
MSLKLVETRQGSAVLVKKIEAAKRQKANRDFLYLVGFDALAVYVVERHAEKALPLLHAIHRRQMVSGKKSVALTPAVWAEAGNPSQRTRKTVLALLRRMPDLITIREAKSYVYRYYVAKTPLWSTFETAKPASDEEPDIANDDSAA